MKVLIVDDEPLARAEIRQLLSGYVEVEVVGEAGGVEQALELTAKLEPTCVFLDVQMRGESGFDYVGRLAEPMPRIIFVTAHDAYAVRGFECNALDYLLKPVHPERLKETIRRLGLDGQQRPKQALDEDLLLIKCNGSAKFVPWVEIGCILSEGNYTRVVLQNGDPCLVLRPLHDWLDQVPVGRFVRIRRTSLVRLSWIREVRTRSSGEREVLLRDGKCLTIGRSFWPELKIALGLT